MTPAEQSIPILNLTRLGFYYFLRKLKFANIRLHPHLLPIVMTQSVSYIISICITSLSPLLSVSPHTSVTLLQHKIKVLCSSYDQTILYDCKPLASPTIELSIVLFT
jgi:hypothetical protein